MSETKEIRCKCGKVRMVSTSEAKIVKSFCCGKQ